MKFGSVCSGIEAASVAWGPLGWEAAWFAEIEPFPSAVLGHHYPEVKNLGDMTQIPALIQRGEVEAPDILCGGTPCQAFSVAGLRRSLDDARGNLSLTFCEIANAIDSVRTVREEPAAIVFWENVPGVTSTKDNAFGCFLGALAGCDTAIVPSGRWTDAGVVAGPQRTVAWRILDAQYFGLAQRRRRVFVVASARDGFDPAAVLFEFDGMRRDSAPSREAGKAVTDGAGAGAANGIDFQNAALSGDLAGTLDAEGQKRGNRGHGILAFGGGQNCAQTDVSTSLSAHPGGSRLDFQTETFVAHSLRGEGFDASEDDTGRGTPLVPAVAPSHVVGGGFNGPVGITLHGTDGTASVASLTDLSSSLRARIPSGVENSTTTAVMQPVTYDFFNITAPVNRQSRKPGDPCHTLARSNAEHAVVMQPVAWTGDGVTADPISASEGRTYTHEGATFRLHNCVQQPVAFDTTQITHPANHSSPKPGDPCHPLAAGAHAPAVAIQDVRGLDKAQNGRGWNDDGTAYTVDTHATQGVAAFAQNQRDEVRLMDVAGALAADPGMKQQTYLQTAMQVRRLTPIECERLQGFPDGYTAIPWRGKVASECPDGPRYKALGNSWAVPVVRWIGWRIECLANLV